MLPAAESAASAALKRAGVATDPSIRIYLWEQCGVKALEVVTTVLLFEVGPSEVGVIEGAGAVPLTVDVLVPNLFASWQVSFARILYCLNRSGHACVRARCRPVAAFVDATLHLRCLLVVPILYEVGCLKCGVDLNSGSDAQQACSSELCHCGLVVF